ncbi:MAG: ATP-grasp domain-containing protein, partial [Candidatus Methanoperedens sp.]|nr:ATP-grasp domain-containing protein [Candidatus Methanoperedens sp.]
AEETLLDHFVRSCVFVHDDWIPASGRADWGAYDTNPFLLGADICVVNTLKGFGPEYLDYLQDLDSLPEHIIIPERRGDNLTLNLLGDERTLAHVRELVNERQLGISVFYNDDERGLEQLVEGLSTSEWYPPLYPTRTSFEAVNSKIDGMYYAQKAGVPTPESAICRNIEEVRRFFNDDRRVAKTVIIKADHRKLMIAETEEEVVRAAALFEFPLLVETLYEVKASPSLNRVVWQGEAHSYVVTDQVLEQRSHRGNIIPSGMSPEVDHKIRDYTARIGDVIPDLQGVFGVDYVVTTDDEVFAVDINPRFCSGTYPLQFLERLGVHLNAIHARYQLAHCNVESLSTILCDPEFVPFAPESEDGILIYDPVVYEGLKPVHYFSYLVVAHSAADLAVLEQRMDAIIARHQPRGDE